MRKAIETDSDLKERLKAELASFKELHAQKEAMWASDTIVTRLPEWELLKAKLADCVEEINHLHRKLHPYFPRGATCGQCGADTLPVLGSDAKLDGCIACGAITDRWSL